MKGSLSWHLPSRAGAVAPLAHSVEYTIKTKEFFVMKNSVRDLARWGFERKIPEYLEKSWMERTECENPVGAAMSSFYDTTLLWIFAACAVAYLGLSLVFAGFPSPIYVSDEANLIALIGSILTGALALLFLRATDTEKTGESFLADLEMIVADLSFLSLNNYPVSLEDVFGMSRNQTIKMVEAMFRHIVDEALSKGSESQQVAKIYNALNRLQLLNKPMPAYLPKV